MLPPVALFPEGPDQTGRQASVPDYSSELKSPLFGLTVHRLVSISVVGRESQKLQDRQQVLHVQIQARLR